MSISCRWRTNTLRTLKPCHSDGIKSVKISENFSFGSSSSKYDDFRSCKYSRMSISWSRWSSWDFGFGKFICIDIENVGIVKISITLSLSCKVMAPKNNNWSSWKSSWMSSSWTRTYTLNNWICPLPSSDLKLSIRKLTWWLFRIWALTFLSTFFTWRVTFLLTVLRSLWLFHLLHVWTFLLLLLIFVRPISLIRPILLWVIRLIITFH